VVVKIHLSVELHLATVEVGEKVGLIVVALLDPG
jgi:hypothetical protein